jgi:hypothetical protein
MNATIPLARASLCIDCESIRPSEVRECPACGSPSAMPLARWLDRKPGPYHVTAAGHAALAEPR